MLNHRELQTGGIKTMRKVSKSTSRSYRTPIATALLFSMALLLAPCSSWAQKVTAAITGRVTDSSGAAIAGAKVTATDLERGTVQKKP